MIFFIEALEIFSVMLYNTICRVRGVAQFGMSACLGCKRSLVQIQSLRPLKKARVKRNSALAFLYALFFISLFCYDIIIPVQTEAGIVEDKTFELMEKMYSEINKRFDSMQGDIQGIKGDIRQVKKEVRHVRNQVTRLEYEHGKKIDALFDGYKQLYEKLEEHDKRFDEHDKRFDDHDKRLDRIEAKLDKLSHKVSSHDAKLEVLEGGRKK
jgi:peptidoglycan hydrolase CwlO-like protein